MLERKRREPGNVAAIRFAAALTALAMGTACRPAEPVAPATGSPNAPGASSEVVRGAPSAEGSAAPASEPTCTATASRTVPIYMRPKSDDRFGELAPGDSIDVVARSKEGFLGFDPGTAQAANIGPFRLRWLDPADVTIRGDCARVGVTWTAAPNLCMEMTMEDLAVLERPSPDARTVVTLHVGEFGALVERSGKWFKIDLGPGNTGSRAVGWIPFDSTNVSGPCEFLGEP